MPTMPNVVGLDWQQATVNLILAGVTPDNGLVVGTTYPTVGYFDKWPITVAWVAGSGAKPGFVTAQKPAAGAAVAFNAAVNLTLANYPMGVANLYSAGGYS